MPRHGHQTATTTAGADAGAAVLAFRPRGEAGRAQIVFRAEDRPAPSLPPRNGAALLLLLLGSLAAHAGLAVLFNVPARLVPAVGIPAITVDIVIGDNAAAGLNSAPGREQAVEITALATVSPEQAIAALEPVNPVMLAEAAAPLAPQRPPPAMSPAEPVHPATAPAERPIAAETAPEAVAAPASVRPVELAHQPPDTAEAIRRTEEVAAIRRVPARNRPRAKTAPASAASGISRGGSAAAANYHGRVAAHLARHKRFPQEARRRGEHGSAGVDFSVDANGRVTAVRIAQTSGFSSLDRAAEAMVWRASPFPAPPDGRPQRFRVPISYSVH
jgi:protein TonB